MTTRGIRAVSAAASLALAAVPAVAAQAANQLTSGKDKVRIFKSGKNPGAVIMPYKYVRD